MMISTSLEQAKFEDSCDWNRKQAWNFEIYFGFLEGVEEDLRVGNISFTNTLNSLEFKSICVLYEIRE